MAFLKQNPCDMCRDMSHGLVGMETHLEYEFECNKLSGRLRLLAT